MEAKHLGQRSTGPSDALDVFPNPNPGSNGLVHIWTDEFTCFCPVTGQPDFAHFKLWYIPDEKCVELKSLKLYLWTFREKGAFHEKVTGEILTKLVDVLQPRFAHLVMKFNVRGGLFTDVLQTYKRPEWDAGVQLLATSEGVTVVVPA